MLILIYFRISLLFSQVHIFTRTFMYLSLPLPVLFSSQTLHCSQIPQFTTPQAMSQASGSFVLCSGCLPFLVWHSLSKADSLSSFHLSTSTWMFPHLFHVSTRSCVFFFSKFMHDSVLLYDQFNRFCRDVYMSYLY